MKTLHLGLHFWHGELVSATQMTLEERIAEIKTDKPLSQQRTRLRLIREILPSELPETLRPIWAALQKAKADVDKAWAEWDKARAAWRKALVENRGILEAWHKSICANCPWNGKEIVFET